MVAPIRYLHTALLLVLLISCKDKKVKVWISFFPAYGREIQNNKKWNLREMVQKHSVCQFVPVKDAAKDVSIKILLCEKSNLVMSSSSTAILWRKSSCLIWNLKGLNSKKLKVVTWVWSWTSLAWKQWIWSREYLAKPSAPENCPSDQTLWSDSSQGSCFRWWRCGTQLPLVPFEDS